MGSLPSGTVTFLFTDIEGSTRLAQQYPDAMPALLARHHEILKQSIEAQNGYVFQIIGDAFCAAFHTAPEAFNAALTAQRALVCEPWSPASIKVRMGLHTGAAQAGAIEDKAGGYVGYLTLTRVQRVMSLAHGGQILVSHSAAELVRGELPKQVSLRDMGEHTLKGLVNPDHLWQPLASDLPSNFPALQSLKTIPNNLPVQLTSFIGREKEMAEIKQALAEHRLVTLTGSGGAGKSRLSLQAATDSLDLFSNGIWLVELAPLAEPDLIPQTILSAAGIQTSQGLTAMEALTDFLREKTALLILDNCEHLIEACARLVETLLNTAPNLKILASSREALGVKGEQSWRVPSLSIPDVKHLPAIDQLAQYEAVRLFIDRALLVQPHFAITNENTSAVAKVCQRLDGIPLALELAAARLRTLSVEQIAVRLDDSFRLLTGGTRTALPRQQTLRALIDWSYNLLSEPEKILFRRLAVFAGGWTLEAAESVCEGGGIEPGDVLDLLDHLVDKSLVISVQDAHGTRYRRLETIRQYAREKLAESGEGATHRDRHLAYFWQWVSDMEPALRGPQQVELLNRLENEIDNLRSALEWAQESDPASGLQLASMLNWFWHLCGLGEEGAGWLENLLASSKKPEVEIEPLLKARSLSVFAWLSYLAGSIQVALPSLEESIELCQTYPGSIADLITADNLYLSGVLALTRGALSEAKPLAEQSLGLSQAWGDKFRMAQGYSLLGSIAFFAGDFESAGYLREACIVIRREIGDKDGLAFELAINFGVPFSQGDYENVKRILTAAVEAGKQTRFEFSLGLALMGFGITYLFEDNFGQAADYLSQLITLAHEKSNTILKILGVHYMALSLYKQSRYRTARQLNGAIEGLRHFQYAILYEFPMLHTAREQYLLEAREALGETDYNAAYAEGRAMTLDQATAYALKALGQ
jgi:predicted ATPase/class 3 adenylate cyclase